MFPTKLAPLLLLLLTQIAIALSHISSFTFNGFKSANLTLDGLAKITQNGLLQLSNDTKQQTGHAFYPKPFYFKKSPNSSLLSFSTCFVFAIAPEFQLLGGHGMAFVIAPTRGLPGSLPSTYLGLFNDTNNGNRSNHVLAIELDTLRSAEFNDTNDNHVGIDINSLFSASSKPTSYYDDKTASFQNLTLNSGRRLQIWIEYDSLSELLNVTVAPIELQKPSIPLLSFRYEYDLSTVINQVMYVGFSGAPLLTSHYVLGWSFSIDGVAPPLDLSRLPKLPRIGPKKRSMFLTVDLPLIIAVCLLLGILSLAYYVIRQRKYAEIVEEWEVNYTSHRFRYKDLYKATEGFKERGLLGRGGFGKVYKGVMCDSKREVAVKKVCHESRQGMKEFVAEIVSIGRMRHRNLVSLLGYCLRKGELLLVYEYMPNGSLDKYLHDQPKITLNWDQRFRVIKGVAAGLLYLHEEWEQVVIHRDVKASNVLLDGEMNGRLGDFGLARLYDHGSDPQTTHVVGTLGYIAPEHTRTGKATTCSDVYAFGAFLLEVCCGRRPVEPKSSSEMAVLVEWVFALWSKGEILGAVDPNLGNGYDKREVELVLKLGLLCSHSRPDVRPQMREIVRYLEGEGDLPELSSSDSGLPFAGYEGFDDFQMSIPRSTQTQTQTTVMFSGSSTVTNSFISSGR